MRLFVQIGRYAPVALMLLGAVILLITGQPGWGAFTAGATIAYLHKICE